MSESESQSSQTTGKRPSLHRPNERVWFLSGQADEQEPTRQHNIVSETFTIGRGRDSDLHLPAGCISKEHAIITIQADGSLLLRELGSTNGCLLYTSPSPRDRG